MLSRRRRGQEGQRKHPGQTLGAAFVALGEADYPRRLQAIDDAPPLIAVGVKLDSHTHAIIDESREFVLNFIAKGDSSLAVNFFKAVTVEGNRITDIRGDADEKGSRSASSNVQWYMFSPYAGIRAGNAFIDLADAEKARQRAGTADRPSSGAASVKRLGLSRTFSFG